MIDKTVCINLHAATRNTARINCVQGVRSPERKPRTPLILTGESGRMHMHVCASIEQLQTTHLPDTTPQALRYRSSPNAKVDCIREEKNLNANPQLCTTRTCASTVASSAGSALLQQPQCKAKLLTGYTVNANLLYYRVCVPVSALPRPLQRCMRALPRCSLKHGMHTPWHLCPEFLHLSVPVPALPQQVQCLRHTMYRNTNQTPTLNSVCVPVPALPCPPQRCVRGLPRCSHWRCMHTSWHLYPECLH
jgi:hypothetical protein